MNLAAHAPQGRLRALRCGVAMIVALLSLMVASCGLHDELSPEESCAMLLDQKPTGAATPLVVIADTTASVNAFSSAAFDRVVAEASLQTKDFVLIAVDGGEATKVGQGRLSGDEDPRSQTRKRQAENAAYCLTKRIADTVRAKTPGTDLHSALLLAASIVPLTPEDQVVILSDGVTSAGPWALSRSATESESPTELAKAQVANAPVNLGGAQLVWAGLGDSSEVPITRLAWLEGYARGLCDGMGASGCENIVVSDKSPSRDTELPEAPVEDIAVDWAEPEMTQLESACMVSLPGATLFGNDSAELSDAARAGLAQWLPLVDRATAVTITGHTASPPGVSAAQLVSFSELRAASVRDALVALGADQAKLRIMGKGDTEPVVDATNPDGSLNEAVAGANRRVEIFLEGVEACRV